MAYCLRDLFNTSKHILRLDEFNQFIHANTLELDRIMALRIQLELIMLESLGCV
jgi:hypothetical protein